MTTLSVLLLFSLINSVISSKFDPATHRGWHLVNDKKCGIRTQLRVIGGQDVTIGEFPWVVEFSVTKTKENITGFCTGAIISDQFVITAAHCQPEVPYTSKIIVGNVDRNQDPDCDAETNICAPPMKEYEVDKFFHPDYVHFPNGRDIALVKIHDKFEFNDFVSPICLEHGELISKDYTGSDAEFAGWGLLKIDPVTNESSAHTTMQKITLPVQNKSGCAHSIDFILLSSDIEHDKDSFICAGGTAGEYIFPGDSGGVLAVAETVGDDIPRFYGLGVAAMCSEVPSIADVFTKISYYMEWIMDTIANESKI
uniref:Easter-13 n=1 Tax=Nilaparvata lugens TaxID=108931 RepID=A0A068F668_NILLU|nr:easter-13 [Nilaparvata lugens]APA33896.1 seminal fluid protein [Nilaparvata lugens]